MKASFVRKVFRSVVPILTILVAAVGVRADTLVMNSGRRVEGKVIQQAEDSVSIQIAPFAEIRLSRSDIAEIIIVPVPVPERKISPPTNAVPTAPTPPAAAPAPPTPAPLTPAAPAQTALAPAPAPAPATTAAPPATAPAAPPAPAAISATAARTPPPAKPPVKQEPGAVPAMVFYTVSRPGSLLFPYPKIEGSPAMNGLWEHSKGRPVTGATPLVLNLNDRVEVVLTNTVVYPATPARPEAKLEVAQVRIRSGGLMDLRTGRRVQMPLFEGWMLLDRLQAPAP